jgi:hypothetical protein
VAGIGAEDLHRLRRTREFLLRPRAAKSVTPDAARERPSAGAQPSRVAAALNADFSSS